MKDDEEKSEGVGKMKKDVYQPNSIPGTNRGLSP